MASDCYPQLHSYLRRYKYSLHWSDPNAKDWHRLRVFTMGHPDTTDWNLVGIFPPSHPTRPLVLPKSIAKISPRPGAARPSLTVRAASSQRAGEQFLAAGTECWLAHELLWKCVSKYSLSPLSAADCHTHSNVVPRESCDFVQLVLTMARIERRCGDQPQQISARQMRLVIGS